MEENSTVIELWKERKRTEEDRIRQKLEKDQQGANGFKQWLDNSIPGDKFCYFTGPYLTGTVARLAREAYNSKLVILYQKREIGKGQFSYWAQRCMREVSY